jgi:hypothetical protein
MTIRITYYRINIGSLGKVSLTRIAMTFVYNQISTIKNTKNFISGFLSSSYIPQYFVARRLGVLAK